MGAILDQRGREAGRGEVLMHEIEQAIADLGKILGDKNRRIASLEGEVKELQAKQQIGWWNPGAKRFCYPDVKQARLQRFCEYSVPVFIEAAR